jgi:hypothetical protein
VTRPSSQDTQDLLQPDLANNERAPADEDNMSGASLQHHLPQTLQDDSVDQDQTAIGRCSTHEGSHNSLLYQRMLQNGILTLCPLGDTQLRVDMLNRINAVSRKNPQPLISQGRETPYTQTISSTLSLTTFGSHRALSLCGFLTRTEFAPMSMLR